MNEETWDFDAGWDEADSTPFRFRFLGQEWELPRQQPAEIILRLERLMFALAEAESSGAEKLPEGIIDASLTTEGILRQLAGDQIVDKWIELGAPYTRLRAVCRQLMAFYRGENPVGDQSDEPEGEAPNRQKRPGQRKSPRAAKKAAPATRRS